MRDASNHADPSPPALELAAVCLDDDVLVAQAQTGDAGAFGELVLRYQQRVYNVCLRVTGHPEDARDLTQDAFLRAYGALGRFKGRSSFYTWLFRIAMNLAISHQRKARRAISISLDAPAEPMGQGGQARDLVRRMANHKAERPEEYLRRREARHRVASALLALDEDHRAVVVLRDIEGLDYQQIADVLEIAVGTVKSRLHRARMILKDQLADLVGNE